MNIFAWIKDQFSLTHNDQCTHCGKQGEVTEISWFYAAYAPRINYPLKRRSIHDNWLCESCMSLCFDNYFDPIGTIKKYRESLARKRKGGDQMTNPNDPSNPCKWVGNLDGMVEMPGLTKREYFAGLAMNGISVWDAEVNEPIHTGKLEELARACVAYADALIAELNKK